MKYRICRRTGISFMLLIAACGFAGAGQSFDTGIRHRQSVRAARVDESGALREKTGERIREIEEKRAGMSEAMREEREKIRELIIKHRRADTDSERAAVAAELRLLIETGFDRRHSALKERLEDLREACRNIEDRLTDNLERREEIISGRVESLLQPPPKRDNNRGDRGMGIVRERKN